MKTPTKNLTYFVNWIAYDDITEPEYEREFDGLRSAIKFAIQQQEEGHHSVLVTDSDGYEACEIG